ncbi:hypothetical protein I551_9083 [Mycobacterium ulcerans str. Harvey]|uniref:Uncharacterized protein n=1 Tax=Mycobacterium ulcerans str. Harvey TaxID=1299332 RepID=A0ABN0R938_MYCUL|nr:hypothetical protein I551_9083 [Mycobacterium ulcerans str. Harvey]
MVALVHRLERWASEQDGAGGKDVTVIFERPPSTPICSSVLEVAHAPRRRPTRLTTRSCAGSQRNRNRATFGGDVGQAIGRAGHKPGCINLSAERFRDLIDPRGAKHGASAEAAFASGPGGQRQIAC